MKKINETNRKIGNRISQLREERKETQRDIAKLLEYNSPQQVSYLETGARELNIQQIIKLANYFNVTTDYLLGLTDVKSTDGDERFICDYTGLDEDTVLCFHHIKTSYISTLVQSYVKNLVLKDIKKFIEISKDYTDKNGKVVISPYDVGINYYDYEELSDAIRRQNKLNELKTELEQAKSEYEEKQNSLSELDADELSHNVDILKRKCFKMDRIINGDKYEISMTFNKTLEKLIKEKAKDVQEDKKKYIQLLKEIGDDMGWNDNDIEKLLKISPYEVNDDDE